MSNSVPLKPAPVYAALLPGSPPVYRNTAPQRVTLSNPATHAHAYNYDTSHTNFYAVPPSHADPPSPTTRVFTLIMTLCCFLLLLLPLLLPQRTPAGDIRTITIISTVLMSICSITFSILMREIHVMQGMGMLATYAALWLQRLENDST